MISKVELLPSVVYRGEPFRRVTAEDYDEAIAALTDAKKQLEPDGLSCSICADGGHRAWECHHNPLVMARLAAKANGSSGTALPWRCYHCNEVFKDAVQAAEHFGDDRNRPEPAKCQKMLEAYADAFERAGLHRNFHNAASVRLLVELGVGDERRTGKVSNLDWDAKKCPVCKGSEIDKP
jgi:hypothetical protein